MISENIKILLIEDNPGDVRLIQEMLKEGHSLHIDLVQADRLDTGLKLIGEDSFDAVLLDLGLPDSRGLDTLNTINAEASGLPIVVLTGIADESAGIAAVQAGAQDYLIKGQVGSAVLLRSIRYAIERKQAEDALRTSEGTYRTLLENLPQKVFFKDKNSAYISCNKNYAMDLKIDPVGIHGKTDYDFYPKELAEKYRADDKRIMESGEMEELEEKYIQDGQDRWVHTVKTPVKDERGSSVGILAIFWDITEHKRSEETLRKVIRALKTLSQCNEVLVRATDESELLRKICHVIVEVGGYRMAWVGFTEEDQKMTIRPMAQIGFENGYLEALRITWANTGLDQSPTGTAIRTAKPCICQDVFSDPGYARWRDNAARFGYVSLIALPLITDKQPFGVLNIYDDEPDAFDDDEVTLLTELADDLAYGIKALRTRAERGKAVAQLSQSVEKLKATLEKTVNALASTAAKRDPYTAGHQQRVTKLAVALAKEMNVPPDQIDGIRIAGLLHDIGKISVPAEILSKPTKLTEAEFNIVKTHCQIGHDILADIDFPWSIATIVLQHHERINGAGYLGGLKGDEILLEARILAVADVVEAMSSHRPYRPARGIDAALEEIKQNRGILYDRAVVDACINLFEKKNFKFE
jgi:PAS domain S-box-containing protein/putative nucleotidyltransferase with HDIG domain